MEPAESSLATGDLQILRSAGLLDARRYLSAAHAIRDEVFWARWGGHALLAVGAGQFLAGVVFFFAYNWNDLSDLSKFAIIETALVTSAAGALVTGLDRAVGQALLIAASVLTGVLLAVIGQIYQTGADAFELFVAWALLILPWTIAARSAAHWLLWLVVALAALALYGEQVLTVVSGVTKGQVWVLIGATIALALAARELGVRYGMSWLGGRWTRLVLVFACLAILFIPAASFVLDDDEFGSGPLCLVAFLLALAGAAATYWRLWPDFAALVIAVGIADLFFICVGYRVIDEAIGFSFSEAGPALTSFGSMVVWAIAGTGGATLAMRHLRNSLQGAHA